jgi:hypothetical protein
MNLGEFHERSESKQIESARAEEESEFESEIEF